MKVLVLSEHDVARLLTMQECIEIMAETFLELASGAFFNPLRQAVRAEGAEGLLGLMPAWRGGAQPLYALKEVCVFPGNPARGLDSHLGTVVLHSGETGEPLAIVNASAITAIRTAAVSAVATRALSNRDASVLAIIGAGVQAQRHLEAIPLVRNVREVRICSRNLDRAAALATTADGRVSVAESVEKAVEGADLIVTATSAREPVLRREWVSPGAHINAVGSSVASARELDADLVAAGSLFVDRTESTVSESGDYLYAVREGAIEGPAHIRGEFGDVLAGRIAGRSSPQEITIFKSLGLAAEDLAAAAFAWRKGREGGVGQWIDF